MSKLNSSKDIMAIAMGYQKSRLLLTAFELNLFTVIDSNSYNAEKIAEVTKCSVRGITKLMDVLTSAGLIHKAGDTYFNTELTSKYLVKDKPGYMAGLAHTAGTWDLWHNLTDAVKDGSMHNFAEINERGPEWLEAFIAAMHDRGVYQAAIISNIIQFYDVNKFLDIGGGSGAFTAAFLEKAKDAEGVIFDLPNVIPITKKYMADTSFGNRVSYLTGNFMKDDLGAGYDLIFLSAIIHMLSYDDNKLLIKKCADALNDGGQLIISDFVISDDRTRPEAAAMFAINMLVSTKNGDTYTENEIKEWAEYANLQFEYLMPTPFTSSLVSIKK